MRHYQNMVKKVSLLLFILSLMSGCNNLDNRVFGKWVEDTHIKKAKILTFNEDGTYSAFYPSNMVGINDINDTGTYTTKEMPNPKKWKNGGCVIVLNSEYGNNYELDFIAYEKGDSSIIEFYEIKTDRSGNVSISNERSDMGIYLKK